MKLRFILLGKDKLDPRGFSFQWLNNIHVAYARIGLFGVMLCLTEIDPVKDLQNMMRDKAASQAFASMNRHDRRTLHKLSRTHARKA